MTLLTELRDSCAMCVCKHLSQALVLMQEVHQGYPKHHWIAVGHLGEAADEAVKEFPKLAEEIRKHRIKYMADPNYSVPVLDLIDKAKGHVKHEAKMTKKGQSFVSDEISHLMKDGPSKGPQKGKKMPQKQAIAVALDVARRKGFKSAPNPNEFDQFETRQYRSLKDQKGGDMSIFDSIVKQESTTSIFDALIEGDLPEAFKKNAGSFSFGKSDDDDDGDDDDNGDDDEGEGCEESVSIFDDIVESNQGGSSLFDEFTASGTVNTESNWDDLVARTLTLAEDLIEIRSSIKSK